MLLNERKMRFSVLLIKHAPPTGLLNPLSYRGQTFSVTGIERFLSPLKIFVMFHGNYSVSMD